MEWSFLPLADAKNIQLNSFDCKNQKINDYLKNSATVCEQELFAHTFIMIHSLDELKVAGYYTLSSSTIPNQYIPDEYRIPEAPYATPAILIGQFGLDKVWHGQSYNGTKVSDLLVFDCYRRIIALHNQNIVAFRAIRVDTEAEDEIAKNFWKRQGFINFKKNENSFFLPVKTLLKFIT